MQIKTRKTNLQQNCDHACTEKKNNLNFQPNKINFEDYRWKRYSLA